MSPFFSLLEGHKLLGSAGRDRLIHVFDIQNNFVLVQTLDDHSASITSIKFNGKYKLQIREFCRKCMNFLLSPRKAKENLEHGRC